MDPSLLPLLGPLLFLLVFSLSLLQTLLSLLLSAPLHCFDYNSLVTVKRRRNLLLPKRRSRLLWPHSAPNLILSNSLETEQLTQNDVFHDCDESSALLDVSRMMCGGCMSRVKLLLSVEDRVDSVVVNMLTETAAIKLKPKVAKANLVAESLA